MKNLLRKICSPILTPLERGSEAYNYKPLNRKVLLIIGFIFLCLGMLVAYLAYQNQQLNYFLPVIVFSAIGLLALIVGGLGSDRAVAKIWGNR
jgi:uncharacterized membrane protein